MTISRQAATARLLEILDDLDIPALHWRFLPLGGTASGRFLISVGNHCYEFTLPGGLREAVRAAKRFYDLRLQQELEREGVGWAPRPEDSIRDEVHRALLEAHVPPWQYAWQGHSTLWLHKRNKIMVLAVTVGTVPRVLQLIAGVGLEAPYAR